MVSPNQKKIIRTTIHLTPDLRNRIDVFNVTHPNRKIKLSEVAREALETELERRSNEK